MVGGSFMLFLTFFVLVNKESSSESPREAEPGQNVTLECHASKDAAIIVLKWIRPDLKSEGYVFFFRDNQTHESFQHPLFCGRVELRDPEMKNGDFSVILKNVTVNDTGTYECFVKTHSNDEFSQFINLTVTESGPTAGNTEGRGDEEGGDEEGGHRDRRTLTAPLVTVAVVFFVIGFVLGKRQRSQHQNSDPPPAAAELQTLSPPSSNSEGPTAGTTEDRGDENGQDDNS